MSEDSKKPPLPMIFGAGPLANAMRETMAKDPDRYRPSTISMSPVGHCPCCDRSVFKVRGQSTNFEDGFATGIEPTDVRHPRMNAQGEVDPSGSIAGCCCQPPNWGPKHKRSGSFQPKP